MEKSIIKKTITTSFLGIHEGIGRSTISLNYASELARKGLRVLYGRSFKDKKNNNILLPQNTSTKKSTEEIIFTPSKISGLNLMTYSNDADKLSPEKMQNLIGSLPNRISKIADHFVFSITDPFTYPDRYILLNTDIYIIVLKISTTVFSDLFQMLEKFAFMPTKPKIIHLIFNGTNDIEKTYFTYYQIIKQANEFNINIELKLLGVIPFDYLRQSYASKQSLTMSQLFYDSSFRGSISFIAEKLTQPEENENLENILAISE